MARTLPVYEMDAESGDSAIYLVDPDTPNDRAPFLNPTAYAKYILFHSGMQFIRVAYDQSKSITFPNMQGVSSDTNEYAFPNHNLGRIPATMVVISGQMLMMGQPIQVSGGRNARTLSLKLTTNGVSVVEWVTKYYADALPAITRTVRVILLDILPTVGGDPFTFDMSVGRVRFGYGRFDNAGPDLLKAAKSNTGVQFYVPKPGPTLDTSNGAIKHVGPDGTVMTVGNYNGSFSGSGGWPVKI